MKAGRLRRDVANERQFACRQRAAVDEGYEDRRTRWLAHQPRDERHVKSEFHAPIVAH